MQAVQVGKLMASVRQLLSPAGPDEADFWEAETVLGRIAEILNHCEELGLAMSRIKAREAASLIQSHIDARSNNPVDVRPIARAVADYVETEIKTRIFFTVRPELVPHLEGRPGFGEAVAAAFPGVSYDIDEAGKCLALSRSTAAVFHLMRIVEAAVKAMGACLGIPDPVKDADRNWGGFQRKIKSAMENRDNNSQTHWKPTDKAFFESAFAHLDAIRIAWRNPTMHVENKYTNEEADGIYACVRAFAKTMASRMDERGEPRA
jgi:hypothetical protein